MQIDLRSDFTLDELLGTLKEQEVESSGFHTSREWGETLGISGYRVTRLFRLALKKGVLLRNRHLRESIDGSLRPVQVYAFNVEEASETEGG